MSPRWLASSVFFMFSGIFAFGFGPAVLRAWESTHWPSAQAVIDSARVKEMLVGGKSSYTEWRVFLRYHFLVNGVRYDGTNFTSTGELYCGDEATARSFAAQYHSGQVVAAFYDPREPSDVLLRPGPDSRHYFVLVSFIVVFAFGIGFAFGFIKVDGQVRR